MIHVLEKSSSYNVVLGESRLGGNFKYPADVLASRAAQVPEGPQDRAPEEPAEQGHQHGGAGQEHEEGGQAGEVLLCHPVQGQVGASS